MSKRATSGPKRPRRKLLLWTALAGLIFGLIGFGEIAEDLLRVARNACIGTRRAATSSSSRSTTSRFATSARWPWPRRYHGELIDRLSGGGREAHLLRHQLLRRDRCGGRLGAGRRAQASGRVDPRHADNLGPVGDGTEGRIPLPMPVYAARGLGDDQLHAIISQTRDWHCPMPARSTARPFRHSRPLLAGARATRRRDFFQLDYSLDLEVDPEHLRLERPRRPVRPAADPRQGRRHRHRERRASATSFSFPAYGRLRGVYVHVIGAETLKGGAPVDLGWVRAVPSGASQSALAR